MSSKNLMAIITAVLAEVLIIILNILLKGDLPGSVVALNIVVCTLIFASSACVMFIKWDRSEDKVSTWIGTLAIDIWGFSVYSILALAAMILMNSHAVVDSISDSYPVAFKYQLLVHSILLAFLFFTRFLGHATADQITNVHVKEAAVRSGLDEMKSAVRRLQDAVFVCQDVSPEVRAQIDRLQQNVRYLSPVNTAEAKDLENDFVGKVNALIPAFINYKMNEDSIRRQVALLEHLFENRKKTYN